MHNGVDLPIFQFKMQDVFVSTVEGCEILPLVLLKDGICTGTIQMMLLKYSFPLTWYLSY